MRKRKDVMYISVLSVSQVLFLLLEEESGEGIISVPKYCKQKLLKEEKREEKNYKSYRNYFRGRHVEN